MSTLREVMAAAGFQIEDTGEHTWRMSVGEIPPAPVRVVRRMSVSGNVRDVGQGMQLELVDVETAAELWVPVLPAGDVVELAPDAELAELRADLREALDLLSDARCKLIDSGVVRRWAQQRRRLRERAEARS